MNDARRQHEVMVRLNDTELARLDENRSAGIARAVYLRGLLREPPDRENIADRPEVLALLSEQPPRRQGRGRDRAPAGAQGRGRADDRRCARAHPWG